MCTVVLVSIIHIDVGSFFPSSTNEIVCRSKNKKFNWKIFLISKAIWKCFFLLLKIKHNFFLSRNYMKIPISIFADTFLPSLGIFSIPKHKNAFFFMIQTNKITCSSEHSERTRQYVLPSFSTWFSHFFFKCVWKWFFHSAHVRFYFQK